MRMKCRFVSAHSMMYEMFCSFRKQLTCSHGMVGHTSTHFVYARSWVQISARKS